MASYLFIFRREEIQKKIEARKNKEAPIAPLKIPENPFLSIKKNIETNNTKSPENPFLSFKKTENTSSSNLAENQKNIELSENKPTGNPFLSIKRTNNAFSENPFLLIKKTENQSLNNLFSTNISKNNLFANVSLFKKEPEIEAKSVSANSKSNSFLKMFPLHNMEMGIFPLNKLESDVIFKVEGQEFAANKSILSKRCKFFKNMFSSNETSDSKIKFFQVECVSHMLQ